MQFTTHQGTTGATYLKYLVVVALCILLAGCGINLPASSNATCQGNCTTGPGVQGVQVYVEPDAGEHPITDAISSAKKSVWVEMYILSDRNVMRALEEAANRGIDVRVMLEPHPFGGGGSPARTMDQLRAAGAKVEESSPSFALTHEKGMIIDNTTVFIMTSNFSRSALGGYSGSNGYSNREYDIVDVNPQDVQAVVAIFQADWDRTTAQFNDANLVVSPVNARNAFVALINSARSTLLVEAEEMNDSAVEQALTNATQRGVQVQVILPASHSSSGDSNGQGIAALKQGGVQVREDA
ncbi:MAG TPA: phospholipase D-like domain-containing protein, partial [Ktedonobacteraceae bacterium]